MSAYGTIDQAVAGLQASFDARIETVVAQEDIGFGMPVMGFVDDPGKGYAMHDDKVTLTLDGDLVASNVYTITINGHAVAGTYASSHAATMTALIAAINADADVQAMGVGGVVAAAGGTNRVITLQAKGVDLTVTGVVTLGAGQAGVTVATTNGSKFLGVAMFRQSGGKDYGSASGGYKQYDAVNVLAEGQVFVPAAAAVKDKEAAYAIIAAGATQGQFTDSSSSTYDVGGFFRSGRNSQNLAILEVRGLK